MKSIKNRGRFYLKYVIPVPGLIDIRRYLPANEYKLVHMIGKYADDFGINAYLVGGFVRDFLLGRKIIDIDITVEGDGTRFTRFLSRKLDCQCKCFEKFKTGKIFLKNKRNIDITSARSEYYEKPAALPKINFSAIQKDLYRRDFTINAMAIQINKNNFGRFIDFFNGFNDLKHGIIRILHNRSFEDDPTRILRAVRFEQRFGFKIESKTLNLLKHTIKNRIFDKLPGERLRDEILLILKEKNAATIIKRGKNLDAWKEIFKVHGFNNEFKKISKNSNFFSRKQIFRNIDMDCARLMMLFTSLSLEQTQNITGRLKLKNEWKEKIISAKKNQKIITRKIKNAKKDRKRIFLLLSNFSREELFYFVSIYGKSIYEAVEKYFEIYDNIKLKITGNDLKNIGIKQGPIYSKILREVFLDKVAGKIRTKAQEIKFVKKRFKGGNEYGNI